MLELSSKYYSTTIDSQKALFAAAGEAMLARGEHGSPGVFIGFTFLTIAHLSISLVMLYGNISKKIIAYFGIIGSILFLIYTTLMTFVPGSKNIAVIIAAPGGLLVLLWNFIIGIKFIKIGLLKKLNDSK